jgi:uncharacterized YccA/Bax inhibitor family protein
MRTSNPALNDKVFQANYGNTAAMTLPGTVAKTAILLGIAIITASISWMEVVHVGPLVRTYLWGGAIGGLITSLITIWKPHVSPVTAPIYAACEGLFLGAISSAFEGMYQGIVVQAAALTFGTLGVLLTAYATRLIRATENFKLGVVAATGAIVVVYLVALVLSLFGVNVSFLNDASPLSIGISVVICIVAALNLVLDFDFIETGCERGAPKYMEWYGAFGLMVTLVWLYLEILRLLAKLNDRR